jgi:hypothetical protein
MAAPNGRIEPGQPLESAISARAWNRAQDAADIVLGAGAGMNAAGPRTAIAPYVVLPCKNNSAEDVPRYGVLAIESLEIEPTSTASDAETLQFQSQPVIRGDLPYGEETIAVIAIQPIPAGSVGMVAVSGVVQARIDIKSASHTLATTKDNEVAEMKTSGSVGYPIIWKQSGTGAGKWALVMLSSRVPHAPQGIRLGKISSTWAKGSTKTVTRYNGDGTEYEDEDSDPTFEAINRFATVTTTAPRWVACANIDGTWHLVAAEC